MDHAYIDGNSIAERYVARGLSASERELFEDHFIDCRRCQERIEAARGLRDGLRAVDKTEIPAGHAPWQSSWARPLAWMAAGLLIAALPGGWFAARSVRLQQELDRALRQPAGPRPGEAALAVTDAPRTFPVYALNVMRAGGTGPPAVTIPVPAQNQPILLELENPLAPEFTEYQVSIADAGGRAVLKGTGLRQSTAEHLTIVISSSSFAPGDYQVTLSGRSRDGREVPVAGFAFRAVRGN